jgi:hypothetical protein
LGEFKDRLRQAREAGGQQREEAEAAAGQARRRSVDLAAEVDRVGEKLELHITDLLKQFNNEFVEFKFDAFSHEGRRLRIFWSDPGTLPDGRPRKYLNQLAFRVRRFHEYADVEVRCKMIVRDAERRRRVLQVDVEDQDPQRLHVFVEQQIVDFAALYSRDWNG